MSTEHATVPAAILAALFCMVGPATSQAQIPTRLVADIQQAPAETTSSEASDFVVFDGVFYFTAIDEIHGRELWRSDGPAEGTWRVKDLCAGPCSGAPYNLTELDGTLYFLAISKPEWRYEGRELWKSDGTPEGTVPVRRVCYDYCFSGSSEMVAFDGALYIVGYHPALGRELWKSDGTTAGTALLTDLEPGLYSSYPRSLEVWGDHLYFHAQTTAAGSELYRTDGSPEGTELAVDLCPGDCGSGPTWLRALYPDLFIFTADDGVLDRELWAIDGSGEPFLFRDLMPGAQSAVARSFVRRGDEYFFLTSDTDLDPKTWKTDGTAEGTVPVPALQPYGNPHRPWDMLVAGDTIFFTLMLSTVDNAELWASDGTPEGTRLLTAGSDHVNLVGALEEKLVFGLANDGREKGALGATDGTVDGTWTMGGVEPKFLHVTPIFAAHGGQALFAADNGFSGFQPWVSDGTREATELVRRIHSSVGSSDPRWLAGLGGGLVFQAAEGDDTRLWVSDGSEAGTRLMDPVLRLRDEPVKAGDRLFLPASENYGSSRLWTTDDPLAEAHELITPTFLSIRHLTAHGDDVYFTVEKPGQRVWRSDGSDDGTYEVNDVNPGWDPCPAWPCGWPLIPPSRLYSAGDLVYFVAWDADHAEHESQLWATDGSEEGTIPLAAFDSFGRTSYPDNLTDFGEKLLFTVETAEAGHELWASDGTPEGTALVVDQTPGPASSAIHLLAATPEQVFFVLRGEDGRDNLWRTDGTAEGTWRVSDLVVDGAGSEVHQTFVDGSRLYLAVDHPASGDELWTSDGTAKGTVMVADIQPGPAGSTPRSFILVGDRLVFAADDGVSGQEIWTSDGTTEGTFRVADVLPGPGASGPSGFTRIDGWIYFSAARPDVGRELFAVHIRALFRRGLLRRLAEMKR